MAQGMLLLAGYAKVVALAAIVVSGGLIISMFVVPFLTSPIVTSNAADNGATDARRIVTIVPSYADELIFKNVKASDSSMKANSMQWIVDPFGSSMRTFYEHGINGSAPEEDKRAGLET
jgi:xanthine/uracil/vitamin C permease (AzgA family)